MIRADFIHSADHKEALIRAHTRYLADQFLHSSITILIVIFFVFLRCTRIRSSKVFELIEAADEEERHGSENEFMRQHYWGFKWTFERRRMGKISIFYHFLLRVYSRACAWVHTVHLLNIRFVQKMPKEFCLCEHLQFLYALSMRSRIRLAPIMFWYGVLLLLLLLLIMALVCANWNWLPIFTMIQIFS